jgi:hypothetical protein
MESERSLLCSQELANLSQVDSVQTFPIMLP